MGSNSTLKGLNNYITAPGSNGRETTKGVGQVAQQIGIKRELNQGNKSMRQQKKLVNIND